MGTDCLAVLFDLDGVLVDSEQVVERMWNRWAARHPLSVPDFVRRAHGRRSIETVRAVAPYPQVQAAASHALSSAAFSHTDGLLVMPGAGSTALVALADARHAIVTSCGRRLAELRLRSVGLPVPRRPIGPCSPPISNSNAAATVWITPSRRGAYSLSSDIRRSSYSVWPTLTKRPWSGMLGSHSNATGGAWCWTITKDPERSMLQGIRPQVEYSWPEVGVNSDGQTFGYNGMIRFFKIQAGLPLQDQATERRTV